MILKVNSFDDTYKDLSCERLHDFYFLFRLHHIPFEKQLTAFNVYPLILTI